MRLRYEGDTDRIGGDGTRHRGRVRLRFGATADVYEGITAGFRVRTGNSKDSVSPYANIGGDFSSFEIALDRAYANWTPKFAPGLKLTGGKMAHGVKMSPVYGELVWDDDVNPEGVQGRYERTIGGVTVGALVGVYTVHLGPNGGDKNAYLISAQGWMETKPSDDIEIVAAFGFDGYGNMVAGDAGGTSENTPAGSPTILHPLVHVTWSGIPTPVTLSAEFIHNTDASKDENGWAVGAALKFAALGRDHRAYYQFQRIEERAVYRDFAGDDFAKPSDFRGHVFGVKSKLTERISAHTWAIFTKSLAPGAPSAYEKRFRIDLNFKF